MTGQFVVCPCFLQNNKLYFLATFLATSYPAKNVGPIFMENWDVSVSQMADKNKLTKLGNAIAISKSETITD